MSEPTSGQPLPPSIARVVDRFRRMSRDEKMQALVGYARRLEPLPERFRALDRAPFTVPECQTRVDLFAELANGRLHFYADVNARQSPTVAAVLAIVLSAVNDQPPATTLAIPPDFVRRLMEGIGLAAREVGLNAMIQRLKRHARSAQALIDGGASAAAVSSVLLYAMPESGSFVIGDGNASVGSVVTYWGGQWSRSNTLSSGVAPASFKGFIDTPSVGVDGWTSDPGNSSHPPASVPSYLGVVVASRIASSGSTIVGDAPHLVVVRTDPGYAGDPGHAGTGTIIAVVR